jgi:hypothetical protein
MTTAPLKSFFAGTILELSNTTYAGAVLTRCQLISNLEITAGVLQYDRRSTQDKKNREA